MKSKMFVAIVFVLTVGLGVSRAQAQGHSGGRSGGHASASAPYGVGGGVRYAVPRRAGLPRIVTPSIVRMAPYRQVYRPGISLRFGNPYRYRSSYAYPMYGYGAQYQGPYGYGGPAAYSNPYGGVRIQGAPRDAQVYVDGYYAGIADNFDGVFQRVELEAGPHQIEVRIDGYPPNVVNVNVQPGQTLTYRMPAAPVRP